METKLNDNEVNEVARMIKAQPFIFQCLQFAKWYCDMCPNSKTCTFRVNK